MAQTKVAPVFVDADTFFIGKTVSLIEVTYPAAVNTKTGPLSTIQAVHNAIQNEFNILGFGALTDTNTVQAIMIEGEYGTDSYDGTNAESLAVHLEDVIIALGTVDSINLASATVAAKAFALA
jgi:hypothetical protein|tara:strand:+ start:277 stop:645 length:369 start_codon:yes stop_codon:yes gene_type:complete